MADGNQFVSVVASAPGYNDLVIEFEILDAQGGNAKPEVTSLQGLGFVNAVLPGNAISLSGTFADADADDMHTVTVDWGDGNTEVLTASEVNQDSDTFHADHIYSKPGLYDVSVTVSDDVDSDSDSGRAVVVGATLTDAGVLEAVVQIALKSGKQNAASTMSRQNLKILASGTGHFMRMMSPA